MAEVKEETNLKLDNIAGLVDKLISNGYRVIAPKKQERLVLFEEVKSGTEVCLDQVNTNNSIKEFFLPRCEKVLTYKREAKKLEVEEPAVETKKTVIIGSKPCDSASLPVLDKIFGQDPVDSFWFNKRELTTVIGIACTKCDEYCFCTSVDVTPDSKSGSDIILTEGTSGKFSVASVTDKGTGLVNDLSDVFSPGDGNEKHLPISAVGNKVDSGKVKEWLDNNFEDDLWEEFSRQCIGCGTCTFLCPTCHCFDIVDEGKLNKGSRLKNWDACQMETFTTHTSGHNPRSSQDQRWRQRIMHKFRYYVDKFDSILCVGCGRCSRHCPVDMNILECLLLIAKK